MNGSVITAVSHRVCLTNISSIEIHCEERLPNNTYVIYLWRKIELPSLSKATWFHHYLPYTYTATRDSTYYLTIDSHSTCPLVRDAIVQHINHPTWILHCNTSTTLPGYSTATHQPPYLDTPLQHINHPTWILHCNTSTTLPGYSTATHQPPWILHCNTSTTLPGYSTATLTHHYSTQIF